MRHWSVGYNTTDRGIEFLECIIDFIFSNSLQCI